MTFDLPLPMARLHVLPFLRSRGLAAVQGSRRTPQGITIQRPDGHAIELYRDPRCGAAGAASRRPSGRSVLIVGIRPRANSALHGAASALWLRRGWRSPNCPRSRTTFYGWNYNSLIGAVVSSTRQLRMRPGGSSEEVALYRAQAVPGAHEVALRRRVQRLHTHAGGRRATCRMGRCTPACEPSEDYSSAVVLVAVVAPPRQPQPDGRHTSHRNGPVASDLSRGDAGGGPPWRIAAPGHRLVSRLRGAPVAMDDVEVRRRRGCARPQLVSAAIAAWKAGGGCHAVAKRASHIVVERSSACRQYTPRLAPSPTARGVVVEIVGRQGARARRDHDEHGTRFKLPPLPAATAGSIPRSQLRPTR